MEDNTPQLENGYSRFANEILEALARFNMSGSENRVLWAIFRKTYGWGKPKDKISLEQISALTGIARPNVVREIKKLVARGVIQSDNTYIKTYWFNKKTSTWKVLSNPITPRNKTVIQTDNTSGTMPASKELLSDPITPKTDKKAAKSVIQMDNRVLSDPITKVLSKRITTKEKKETKQKIESLSQKKSQQHTTANSLEDTAKNSLTACTEEELYQIAYDLKIPLEYVEGKHTEMLELIESGDMRRKYPKNTKMYFTLRNWLRGDKKKNFVHELDATGLMELEHNSPENRRQLLKVGEEIAREEALL